MFHPKNFIILAFTYMSEGFLGGSDSKETVFSRNTGDPGLIPGSGRSPGECKGSPHQYSCLENSMEIWVCRLQSMGLQRVRHNWATNSFTFLFRSMTYFKLIIVYGVKYKSSFILLNVDIQLSLHYLLKSLLMPHRTVLTTLSNTDHKGKGFPLDSWFHPTDLYI